MSECPSLSWLSWLSSRPLFGRGIVRDIMRASRADAAPGSRWIGRGGCGRSRRRRRDGVSSSFVRGGGSSSSSILSASSSASASDDVGGVAYVVTGGLGFIGTRLCERLIERGASTVVCVDAVGDEDNGKPYPKAWKEANAKRLRSIGVDVRDHCDVAVRGNVEEVVRGVSSSSSSSRGARVRVAHLAARSGVGAAAGDPAGAVRANVGSTAAVLDAAAAASDVVERVVIASSGSVYGEAATREDGSPRPSVAGEDSTDSPTSAYAVTKRSAELLGKVYAEQFGVSVVVARIFTVYGERGRPDMAVWKFIKQLESGADLTRFGDGASTWRDYLHVDDCCDALARALTCDMAQPYTVVNVAGGKPVYLHEIIDGCERACERTGSIRELPGRPGDVGGTYGDISATETTLRGWKPRVSLAEGLRRTVAWWRSSEADAYREP
jgi:UDP-glucuronate 4-epimerase